MFGAGAGAGPGPDADTAPDADAAPDADTATDADADAATDAAFAPCGARIGGPSPCAASRQRARRALGSTDVCKRPPRSWIDRRARGGVPARAPARGRALAPASTGPTCSAARSAARESCRPRCSSQRRALHHRRRLRRDRGATRSRPRDAIPAHAVMPRAEIDCGTSAGKPALLAKPVLQGCRCCNRSRRRSGCRCCSRRSAMLRQQPRGR